MKQNQSSQEEGLDAEAQNLQNDFYPHASNTRNICFVLNEGKNLFLNYSYLVSCEYTTEENKIVLVFTTHTIELKGERLEPLFEGLFFNAVKKIVVTDNRYNEVEDNTKPVVNTIVVKKNDE